MTTRPLPTMDDIAARKRLIDHAWYCLNAARRARLSGRPATLYILRHLAGAAASRRIASETAN